MTTEKGAPPRARPHPSEVGARPSKIQPLAADDKLLGLVTELEFMARWYAAAWQKHPLALEIALHVPADALQGEFWRAAYEYMAGVLAKGDSIADLVTERYLLHIAGQVPNGDQLRSQMDSWLGREQDPDDLRRFAHELLKQHRGRAQLEIVKGAITLTEDAMQGGGSLRRVVDDLVDRLTNLHTKFSDNVGPQTQAEIAQYMLKRLESTTPDGYAWPWAKVQRLLGIVPPGKVYGVTAYSGNGKSLFACNLFREWVTRGVPVIVFPTEMDLQWLERAVASMARVPKHYAEEADWRTATGEEVKRYREALRALVGLQWDIVQQPGISPAEIMARVRILRRKYRGQQVIVFVDYMHRLEYPDGVSADDALGAGHATKHFKNHARSDREGGLTYFLLYQPTKPGEEGKQYRPVAGVTGIRGHGSSFQEVDVHLSPWRRVVKTTPHLLTEWGTPLAVYEDETSHMPAPGKFNASDTKLDDEHFYLTNDKHRIRGATLETVMLNIHGPSGYIYEEWPTPTQG